MICRLHFFSSSRRRHTRWPRDWSSDVCSSDLNTLSPLDRVNYEEIDLFAKLNATEHGRKCHLKDGDINYQPMQTQIGRASCRERGESAGVGGGVRKKEQ